MIEKKTCGKCKVEKPIGEFNIKNPVTDLHQSYCKSCQKQYRRMHYLNNRFYYINKTKKRKQSIATWMVDYKSKLKCSSCGESHIACLVFHHDDPNEKESNVSECVGKGWSKKRILEEISKCVVYCFNCHIKLHYNERKTT